MIAALRRAMLPWAISRVLVGLGFLYALAASGDPKPLPLEQGLLSWDATWYRSIADLGYDGAPEGAIRFFPLLPILGRWVTPIVGGRSDVALVALTWLVALAATAALSELVRVELGQRSTLNPASSSAGADLSAGRVATRAAWVWSVFPTAFVLVAPYTEAFLVLFASLFALSLRKRQWLAVIAFGFLAGLSRPVGGLLVVFAAAELWKHRPAGIQLAPALAGLASPAVGVTSFGVWAAQSGQGFFAPFDAQSELRGRFHDPITRFAQAVWRGFGGDQTELLHALATVVFAGLIIVVWRAGLTSWAIYGAIGLLVAISSSNINSLVRYGHGLIPVLLGAALVLSGERSDRRFEIATLATASLGVIVLTAAIFSRKYVP